MPPTNLMTRPQRWIGFPKRPHALAIIALLAVQPGQSCVSFAQSKAPPNLATPAAASDAAPGSSLLASGVLANNVVASNVVAGGDAWRRTSVGWQQLPMGAPHSRSFEPSLHTSLAQTWPAAWAACMLLSILALAECDLRALCK